VTPAQILMVDATWRAASARPAELRAAIAANLPTDSRDADERARWIMRTVDRLAPLLTSPTQLCIAANEIIERRGTVTSADLVAWRDAMLAGLNEVLGPQPEATLVAWHQACGLFADVIAALIVNPFYAE
jgi:hypothetical protein